MTYANTWSVALSGAAGQLIRITVRLPPTTAASDHTQQNPWSDEHRDRVWAAIRNSGEDGPRSPILIEADHDRGTSPTVHDLAIAVAVLTAAQRMPPLTDTILLGELGLDGTVRPTRGILACLLALRSGPGPRRVIVPRSALAQAVLVDGLDVLGVSTLAEVVAHAHGRTDGASAVETTASSAPDASDRVDHLPDLDCSPWVLRSLAAAAAGGHHLLITGPDDVGRSAFARSLASLLPPLRRDQALRLSAVRSLITPRHTTTDTVAPFVDPHHSATSAALLGGKAVPGAVSRATFGVLHLADAGQWRRPWWEMLLGILQCQHVRLVTSGVLSEYPADMQLVLSCQDTATEARHIPPFILDRIPVRLRLFDDDRATGERGREDAERFDSVKAAVRAARARAATRWDAIAATNSSVPMETLRALTPFPQAVVDRLDYQHRVVGALSRRGVDEVYRLAWTLADLDDVDRPKGRHVEEALAMRLHGRPSTP